MAQTMAARRPRRSVSATRKRVAAAHRRLDELFAETSAALRAGRADAAREAVVRLEAALHVHFAQEDLLYHPPIRALRPQRAAAIAALAAAHERFRDDLAAIATRLERGALADAATAFATLHGAFGEHELAEETMLRSLERELAAG
jgi:hypothetical protein